MLNPQTVIIVMSIVLLFYLYRKFKKGIGQELIIALIISIAWVSGSGLYTYVGENHTLFGLNLFPVIAWTAGLVIVRELYEKSGKNLPKIIVVYLASLLILEYMGFNIFGIQLASNHPGLFGMDLLHIPTFGKIFYLTIGPIYLLLTDYLEVK